jgi:hypothetical protein
MQSLENRWKVERFSELKATESTFAYIKFAVAEIRGILIATNWELIIYSSKAKIFSDEWMKQRKFSRNN